MPVAASRRTRSSSPRALIRAAAALATLGPAQSALQAVAEGAAGLRDGAVATVRLHGGTGTGLRLAASAGPSHDVDALDARVAVTVLRGARALFIPHVTADRRVPPGDLWRARGYTAYLGLPLPAPGGPLGVLGLALPAGASPLSGEERRLLDVYAGEAALALRHERLADTVSRQVAALDTARTELLETARVLALGQLVGGVAHDVNNLLASVALTIESLLERHPDASTHGELRLLDGQYRQIAELIADLRRFSGNTGSGAVDVRAATERVLRLRQARLRAHGIVVEREYGDDVPPAAHGRAIVERAILTLVLHAEERLAALESGGRLRIRTERLARQDTAWIALDVEDDGPRLTAEAVGHLFDPFAPGDGARGRAVGLAAAQAGITGLGGRLVATPGVARGLRYRLELSAG